VWGDKIVTAKERFTSLLSETEANAVGENGEVSVELGAINERYAEAGVRVDALQAANEVDEALQVHIQSEHEISHELETGFVTVGNFGSPNRMDYTVIGNHVNLASRLADDAAGGEILISERTLALLPKELVRAEQAGERNLKGVQRPIRLYRIS
jgi:class 3 adenylate cyclase